MNTSTSLVCYVCLKVVTLYRFFVCLFCFYNGFFPSLYEGFGIPILEAYACHCPIAISNTSCFPEIAGDAAIYFDPYSVKDIANTIEAIIYNPQKANELIQKGFYKTIEVFV